jgi:transcription elongation factor Elf1
MMKNKYLQKIACPLCGKNSYKILFASTLNEDDFDPEIIKLDLKNTLDDYKKHSRIVKCVSCGLVYTNPMENFSQLLKGYKDVVDKEYLNTEKNLKIISQQNLDKIAKH